MKLGVIGSRSFNNYDLLDLELNVYQEVGSDISEIVSGGAVGADTLAAKWAINNNIPVKVFNADWRRYGVSAGFNRNGLIVAYSDAVVAFWDGISKGTADSLNKAKRLGKPVKVVLF